MNGGEKVHTGLVPFLKVFESSVKSCSQGGMRGGASTAHYPFWHKEIMEVLVLKNNTGNDLNRVRRMDHSIQLCRLFYRRFISKQNITLFSPNDVPDLYDAFGYDNDLFEKLYEKYESDKKISKISIPSVEVMNLLLQERLETGRIYIQNLDNANSHSGFLDKINMSNLCQEVTLPTSPFYDINSPEDGEIALCVLGAINLGTIKSLDELEEISEYTVRMLDYIIEIQDYPVEAAKKMLKRRSLGVGVTNFAYWLAKNGLDYSRDSFNEIDRLFEHIQFYLLKASNKLAKEYGKCEYFERTKYSKGLLPIDHYSKSVDTIVDRKLLS